MAIDIIFYNTNSERNVISKTITETATYSCTLKDGVNAVTPQIIITAETISGNYAYIADFKRYYYITSIRTIRNGLWEITLECDVLMSYKTAILNTHIISGNAASNYNRLIKHSIPMAADNLNLYRIVDGDMIFNPAAMTSGTPNIVVTALGGGSAV